MTFINSLFLFFAGQGFFLAFLLLQNRKVKSNPWIGLFIGSYSVILIYWVLWWAQVPDKYIYTSFNIPAELGLGPLFYLSIIQASKRKYLWHFALPLLAVVLLSPYWLYVPSLIDLPQYYKDFLSLGIPKVGPIIWCSLIFYFILSLKLIKSKEQIWLTASYAVFILGSLGYRAMTHLELMVPWFDYALSVLITITFYSAGYYYFIKYKPYSNKLRNSIEPALSIEVVEKLILDQKKYLNANYRLDDLARDLNLQTKDLSAIIKLGGYSSFKEFINKFRVDHSKHLLTDTDQKIFAIALESGFSNKVSYIQNFKKDTGITPNEYRGIHTRAK